jgi:hypothetical protein
LKLFKKAPSGANPFINFIYIFMFYTLTLTIQKKYNGKFSNGARDFLKDFHKFQRQCNENIQSDFKGLNSIINANNDFVYMFFISASLDYLEMLKNELNQMLLHRKTTLQYPLEYKFDFGNIKNNFEK